MKWHPSQRPLVLKVYRMHRAAYCVDEIGKAVKRPMHIVRSWLEAANQHPWEPPSWEQALRAFRSVMETEDNRIIEYHYRLTPAQVGWIRRHAQLLTAYHASCRLSRSKLMPTSIVRFHSRPCSKLAPTPTSASQSASKPAGSSSPKATTPYLAPPSSSNGSTTSPNSPPTSVSPVVPLAASSNPTDPASSMP